MQNKNALNLCYTALFTAIITVCGWICLPVGALKYTLQLLGVLLCGGLLDWKRGLVAVFAYILLGSLGVPVFSGFSAGLFSSPTGGYIVGFLLTVTVVGLGYKIEYKSENVKRKNRINLVLHAFFMSLGVFLCYVFGTVWFMVYSAMGGTAVTFWSAVSVCVLPYLWFDGVKIMLALFLVNKLKRFLK